MYIILFVILLIILSAVAFFAHLADITQHKMMYSTQSVVQSTAQQGAEILDACSKEQSSGIYTVSQLTQDSYLPNGFPTDSAMGPEWGCQVSYNGVDGANVNLVMMSGQFTSLPGKGSLSTRSNSLQLQAAWILAGAIWPQISSTPNAVVGVVPANSTTLYTVLNNQQYNLSGLIKSSDYAQTVIAQNIISDNLSSGS